MSIAEKFKLTTYRCVKCLLPGQLPDNGKSSALLSIVYKVYLPGLFTVSIYPSIHPSKDTFLSISLSKARSSECLSVCLSVRPSVSFSLSLYVYLFSSLSVSIYLSIYLSIYSGLFIDRSIYLPVFKFNVDNHYWIDLNMYAHTYIYIYYI